ncbi:MAG: hypothetical protein JJE30_19275 [Desulfuromonadales bacterium]|nr:hypothetical protein [Desulfuromonadales bacterium]
MRLKNVFGILLSLFALVIVGCGGGGDSAGGGGGGGVSGTVVSGSAVKGPVIGGTIQAFEIISSASTPRTNIPRIGTTVIATGSTAADGSFSLVLPPTLKNGGVLFKLTNGTYKDEATGTTRNVVDQAAGGLRAAFSNISGTVRRGDVLTVNVTPFTELGVQTLGAAAPTDAAIKAANARVVTTFGLTGIDILKTKPFDATTTPPAGATQAQTDYSQALAILSQRQKDSSITLDQLNALLLPDVNAGVLSVANSNAAIVAELNFANSGFDKTNLANHHPVTVSVTPATPTTAVINSTVTITATVIHNGVPAPAGVIVNFSIQSGLGGTLSPASGITTTNASGVASVTLTSATDAAAYVVTAAAGGHTGDTALITFANPNKPGAITLAANPATGVIPPNQVPITLTATVTPAGVGGTIATGTPVTFTITGGTAAASATISAVTTTNAAGVATATLNSTVAGTVTVNARAGTAPIVTSNTVSVSFISQPTLAIVKVRTTGTLVGTIIGGINAIVSAAPSTGLSIAPADITASGAGAGSTLIPNTTNVASINLALINTAGILVGEFATLNYHIAAGNFPVAGNFTVALTGAGVIDTVGANIPGIAVSVLSVTIQ